MRNVVWGEITLTSSFDNLYYKLLLLLALLAARKRKLEFMGSGDLVSSQTAFYVYEL